MVSRSGKLAGKNTILVFLGIVQSSRAQTFCPAPSDQCLEHRKCAFGSEDTYANALKTVLNLTGCDNCLNICSPCNCSFADSEIDTDIQAGLFCEKSSFCDNQNVIYMMNYLVNNFNLCEQNVIRVQSYLIQLCGRVNDQCCNGRCSEQSQITVPDSMCDQDKGPPAFIRWVLTGYIMFAIMLWEFASI